MIPFCKYKEFLFRCWSSRFILKQKNARQRFILCMLSSDTESPHLPICRRYFCTFVRNCTLRTNGGNKLQIEKYSTMFGVTDEKLKRALLSKRNSIRNDDDDDIKRLKEISRFLKSVKISPENQKDISDILSATDSTITVSVIEQRYHCLKEMGFRNITVKTLFFRYESLMNNTVDKLHASGELPCDVQPLDLLISTAGVPNLADIINTKYKNLRSGPLYSMHHAVKLEFLVWRLKSSHQKILNIFKMYASLRSRSFHSIKEMLRILIENNGFSEKMIQSYGFLLCLNGREVLSILKTLPSLLNTLNIGEIIKKYPAILSVRLQSFKEIQKIFQRYNITAEHVMKNPNVMMLPPDIVSERLKFLEDTPELKQMKSNPRYLLLVYSFSKVLKRLEHVKKTNLPISINILCDSEGYFQNHTSSSEDRLMHSKVIEHIATCLNENKSCIYRKLRRYYIDAKSTSIDEISQKINFLEQNNVPKKVILNHLPLLLDSEQDLLIKTLGLASSQFEMNSRNCSDIDQNVALQALLDIMRSQLNHESYSTEEEIDVNDFLHKF